MNKRTLLSIGFALLLLQGCADTTGRTAGTAPAVPSTEPNTFNFLVPGNTLPVRQVSFVDSRNGWAHLAACAESCQHGLAITGDGGRTWRAVDFPKQQDNTNMEMYPLDARTVSFYVRWQQVREADPVRSFLVTRDGGASFQSYPYAKPPREALLAAGEVGEYKVLCPGATGYEDGAFGISCPLEQLVKVGVGKVQPQPAIVRAGLTRPQQGGDGRLWLIRSDETTTRVSFSRDGAKTWRELPNAVGNATLVLDSDGNDVWLVGRKSLWRLVGDAWQEVTLLPSLPDRFSAAAAGHGALLVTSEQESWFLRDGVVVPLPQVKGGWTRTLSDGTLAVYSGDGVQLGVGVGAGRQWTTIRL